MSHEQSNVYFNVSFGHSDKFLRAIEAHGSAFSEGNSLLPYFSPTPTRPHAESKAARSSHNLMLHDLS
jgi:hypothetical protein